MIPAHPLPKKKHRGGRNARERYKARKRAEEKAEHAKREHRKLKRLMEGFEIIHGFELEKLRGPLRREGWRREVFPPPGKHFVGGEHSRLFRSRDEAVAACEPTSVEPCTCAGGPPGG
jgi:hypothetical protein